LLAALSLALPAFAQIDPTPTTQPAVPTTAPNAQAAPTTIPQAGTDDPTVPQTNVGPTTADFIDGSFVTLPVAVDAAGLREMLSSGEFTMFIPNDGAFQTLANDLGMSLDSLLANRNLLQNVLAYHVVPGIITSNDILTGTLSAVNTAQGSTLSFGFNGDTSRMTINNGAASIEQPDIRTSTGIVHIIDNVLVPSTMNDLSSLGTIDAVDRVGSTDASAAATVEAQSGKTIENISEDSFVVLSQAVKAAGLEDELTSGEYTLFAPNDGAFLTLLNDLGMTYGELLNDQALLESVLTYHLVPGTVTVEDIQDGVGTLETVNGATLSFGFNPDTSRVTINNGAASVEQPDIFAINGVVHIIDNVLLPPQ
jgi:uncharacterized surface protein with fasciclin (FAS1) repeats